MGDNGEPSDTKKGKGKKGKKLIEYGSSTEEESLISSSEESEKASSSSEEESVASSKRSKKGRKKNKKKRGSKRDKDHSREPFNYERLSNSTNFMSCPVGKAPYFNGTHYAKWRHNMKMHLISLNPSIWKVVCVGIEIPEDEDVELTLEQELDIHRNAQAATVLLASLCEEELDRVEGMESARKIWRTLQRAHEGTNNVKQSKIEELEGELGRFVMLDDETPQKMLRRLMVMVNKLRALGSNKYSRHEIVKLITRAFSPRNLTLVTMIRNLREYKRMTPDDVIGYIIQHESMEKQANYVKSIADAMAKHNTNEVALKASKKGKSKQKVQESSSEEDDDSSDIDEEEMALFIKKFKKIMKKDRNNKDKTRTRSKRACYKCGKYGHFIANCPKKDNDDEEDKDKRRDRKSKEKDSKLFKKKKKPIRQAHVAEEDEEESESDSGKEGIATIAMQGTSSRKKLFPNDTDDENDKPRHVCFMAKGRKVTTKVTPSTLESDDDSDSNDSDDEDDSDCEGLLKGLNKKAITKMKKLMEALVDRDELLEKQEDLLILEKERNLELEKLLACKKEEKEKLDQELAKSKETLTSLESSNVALKDKLSGLTKTHKDLEVQFDALWSSSSSNSKDASLSTKASTSNGCAKCFDIDIDAFATNEKKLKHEQEKCRRMNFMIMQGMVGLDDKEREAKYKYARDSWDMENKYSRPMSKYGIGYNKERDVNQKEDKKKITFVQGDTIKDAFGPPPPPPIKTSAKADGNMNKTTKVNNRDAHKKRSGSNNKKKQAHASQETFYADYILTRNYFGKVVAIYVGPRTQGNYIKPCVWVPKVLVTNAKGPKSIWVPKTKM